MFQVRVGCTPGCTTVGNAVREPTGMVGSLLACAKSAPGADTPVARRTAARAADRLVFMAGFGWTGVALESAFLSPRPWDLPGRRGPGRGAGHGSAENGPAMPAR